VLVIGGGRFGRLALERLGGRVSAVVEPEPASGLKDLARAGGVELVKSGGVAALSRALSSPQTPMWVVPALPRHLLVDWLLAELSGQGARPLPTPPGALPAVASLHQGPNGQLYMSLADFLCPDDCPEPANICTSTGQPRGEPLFERLARVDLPDRETAVVRSHQLAPGVGGYRTADLLGLRGRLVARGGRWFIATACRCHGVAGSLALEAR